MNPLAASAMVFAAFAGSILPAVTQDRADNLPAVSGSSVERLAEPHDVIPSRARLVTTDGYALDAVFDTPESLPDTGRRVVILVHGSGSQSLDGDLTTVTRDQAPNLFLRDLSRALTRAGFVVFRYNKRNYQLQADLRESPDFRHSPHLSNYRNNPVWFHVEDCRNAISFAERTVPGAAIYLLGHSEGTYTALQAANGCGKIAGVGMIGFAQYSTDMLVFEQTVYRPLSQFRQFDTNRDGKLDSAELEAEGGFPRSIASQLAVLDSNGDGNCSESEVQAAAMAGLMASDPFAPMREQEARFPRSSDIILKAPFRIVVLQGELDNQTPAYHAKGLDLLARQMGLADRIQVHLFQGLGHALDPRDDIDDLQFRPVRAETLEQIGSLLNTAFCRE